MNSTLQDNIALISGGLGDIGRAIAHELARRGADIALGDLKPPAEAEDVVRSIQRESNRRCRYDRVDVSVASQVEGWVEAVSNEWATPTLIVPNAAVVTTAGPLDISTGQWEHELAINLSGAFFLARSAARQLLADKRLGRIVFVGSWAAHVPHPSIVAYSVAKAGLRMLCRCMALELAEHRILVNEVAPGYVDAGLSAEIFARMPAAREQAMQRSPVHELITPQEVARHVAYFCEPENRNATGSVLVVDGGLSLGVPANSKMRDQS